MELTLGNNFVIGSFYELDNQDLLSIEGGGFWDSFFTGIAVVAGVATGACAILLAVATAPATITTYGVLVGVFTIETAVSSGLAFLASN